MLTAWVNAGGNLIAMRPDAQLASLLGLTVASGTRANQYLLISPSGPGAGLVNETIQFHGTANNYTLSGTSVATLYSTATAATSNPAVTLRSVGSNGGQAAAFAFDLAESVVYTRQGNPAWSGQERDGQSPRSFGRTICSSAPRPATCSRTGSTSTRWRFHRPTSSSGCSRI